MKLTEKEQDMLAGLTLHRGYTQVEAYKQLRVGTRVSIGSGPGTIVAIVEKPDSAWSKSWHMDDVELIVRLDDHRSTARGPAMVAPYHIRQVLS